MDSLARHTDYGSVSLDESDFSDDPLADFARWLREAEDAEVYEPNAMVVSSIDPDGRPSARTVLLKGLDSTGFEFVTNYTSRKGTALLSQPAVSLLFPWYGLNRQVIVDGIAMPTAPAVSDEFFARRPRGARVAAIASDQSQPIASRSILEDRVREIEASYPEGAVIERPEKWGGFRVVPDRIEFWQGRTSRLHDRIRFTATPAGVWSVERLQP
jgi:pyridoxamine 5'-phosphate oxidase